LLSFWLFLGVFFWGRGLGAFSLPFLLLEKKHHFALSWKKDHGIPLLF
jgi:hypothetical protein